jgi:hypothetical protein
MASNVQPWGLLDCGDPMAFDLQTVVVALLSGFVLSLAISQVFRLLSEAVDLEKDNVSRLLVIALMILSGPHLLAATAQKLGRQGTWPTEYVAGVYLVSVLWAGLLGFCVLAALTGA